MARQRLSYEDVLGAADNLSPEEQLRLLAELKQRVESRRTYSIRDLRGFGKEVWRDETGEPIDAQEYVRRERESWRG